MSDPVPIFEIKNKLPLYIHKAENEGPVFISRHGKEVAVILSMEDYIKNESVENPILKWRREHPEFILTEKESEEWDETLNEIRKEYNSLPARAHGEF